MATMARWWLLRQDEAVARWKWHKAWQDGRKTVEKIVGKYGKRCFGGQVNLGRDEAVATCGKMAKKYGKSMGKYGKTRTTSSWRHSWKT